MNGFIINADDYGMAKEINDAVEKLVSFGCLSSTSIMVNMPYVDQIAQLIYTAPDLGVGVHLTLSEGTPISPAHEIQSLVDTDGNFFPPSKLTKKSLQGKISLKQCKLELSRQIAKAKELTNNNIDHWDSHQGIHRLEPLFSVFLHICKKLKIPSMRIHKHYWLSQHSSNHLLDGHRPEGGLKSKLIETYYLWMRWRSQKHFSIPDGILVLDNINQVCQLIKNINNFTGLYEIVCHPATDIEMTSQISSFHKRLKEYNDLSSSKMINILKQSRKRNVLLNFSDLLN